MSLKINVFALIKEHFLTLKNDESGKVSYVDLFSFIFIPLSLSIATILFSIKLNSDFTGAVINFGAIFSALLMSVLVLVYDQDTKLDDSIKSAKENDEIQITKAKYELKKELLKQLYHNICFAIIASLSIVILSLLQILGDFYSWDLASKWIITPFIIFTLSSMVLTTFMVVKRMHALLNASSSQQ
jgi:hypothetical protein